MNTETTTVASLTPPHEAHTYARNKESRKPGPNRQAGDTLCG